MRYHQVMSNQKIIMILGGSEGFAQCILVKEAKIQKIMHILVPLSRNKKLPYDEVAYFVCGEYLWYVWCVYVCSVYMCGVLCVCCECGCMWCGRCVCICGIEFVWLYGLCGLWCVCVCAGR